MRKILILLQILFLLTLTIQCSENEPTFTCDVDTTKTGYDLAAELDDCLVWNAQKKMANIESEDIDIRSTQFASQLDFGSSYAAINGEENWIKPTYMIASEDMSSYPEAPESINGVVLAKFKSKDQIDSEFGFNNDKPQGICADIQQDVYDAVLNRILTVEQRNKYETEGKMMSFIPDDDLPPLDDTTNPVTRGSSWLDVDPAGMITHVGDNYFYEPMSLFVEFHDPEHQTIEEQFRGVRYCKLLSHQAILSWMLSKSFEDNPVLIEETITECNQPSSLETTTGSCFFYFTQAETYFCSDYTGSEFDSENAEAKCFSRPENDTLSPIYSMLSCSERMDEIETTVAGYQGLTGHCVIHCQTPQEFIWNIYTENPEDSCGNFDLFTPDEIE